MVVASELGDAAVTVPVILVVLAWLVWQRRLRSAAYWISAVAFAQLFVVTLKFVMRRARPSSMYEGLQGFSFPSNHAMLSVVTYGFLAFFVARAWPWPTLSWRTATTGASCLSGSCVGLHMGATQGLLATMVASSAPEHLRGTAFGFFNLAGGFVTLMSSVIAGLLWDNFGASAAFYASAGLCGLAIALILAGCES